MSLDLEAAQLALGEIGRQLGTSMIEAAEGISKVVSTNMAEGIRIVSVRRGVDPRHFTLVSFGGAAGLHVTEVARLLEIKRVVIPNVASVLSAWGMLASDYRFEMVRSHVGDASVMTSGALRSILTEMELEGRSRLGDYPGEVTVRRALDMRYGEQVYEITVPIDGVDLDAEDVMERLIELFHKRHDELYAYSAAGQEVVIVNARMAVVGASPEFRAETLQRRARTRDTSHRRSIYLGGWIEAPVYKLDELAIERTIEGPAVIESPTTTVLLRSQETATVTEHGWLQIDLA
jgi:N-methylhydantoinase A